MATFTITTDTNWDTLAGKAGGDTYNINGGILRIDTDTRWGTNSSTTTGTFGPCTISSTLGGTVLMDGTKVRLIPYNTGSGNVPAAGTTITQGGVSASLISVMSAVNVVPTAYGAAMPASGFIKVKNVTGGNFAAGALSGITATATGADVVGWIEIAADEVSANSFTIPRLGKWQITGEWYEAGTTNGSRGQTIQLPNGTAGAGLRTPGVWIETSAGSGTYEFWPAVSTANGFTTANIGANDKGKIVQDATGGLIRIGSDGTNNIGHLPPSGCKVRIPNVILTGNTTAARQTAVIPNSTNTTRFETVTTSAGVLDIDKAFIHWYLNVSQAYSVKLYNTGTFDTVLLSEIAAPLDINNFHVVPANALDAVALVVGSCFAGGTITDCKWGRAGTIAASDHPVTFTDCANITLTRCHAIAFTLRTNSTYPRANFARCDNFTFNDWRNIGVALGLSTCSNSTVTDMKHCDNMAAATTATNGMFAIVMDTKCSDITISGYGDYSSTANQHPYLGLFSLNSSSNIKIRNIGTPTSRYNMGSANASGIVVNHSGNSSNIEVKRVYVSNTRTNVYATLNSETDVVYENVWGDAGDAPNAQCLNMIQRGMYLGGTPTTSFTAVYGSIFWDAFISGTQGRIGIFFNEPTAQQNAYVYDKTITGASGFTSTGSIQLVVLNNTITYEWPYYILGYTSLANVAPVVTGTNTGNHTIEYQIDKGAGWNGSWKTLNAANLSAETGISATTGFKVKIRITCNAASTTNALTGVYFTGTTDTSAQQTQYPLDLNTLTLTGLKNPTEIRVFNANTTTEIAGQESVTSGTFSAEIDAGSYPTVDVSILSLGYQNIRLLGIDISGGDVSIPVQQQIDRQYQNA